MKSRYSKDAQEFETMLAAVEKFRTQDRSASAMIFTDNWYDSHPRMLIFDPILTPYDKLIWMTIRTFCAPDMSLASFPSYDDIQANLHVSRATVSSSIAKLRVTRWITLLCRDRMRNSSGQITKDGNIYLVHGEPLSLVDTIELDGKYMEYLQECKSHRNSDTRKIAEMTLSAIHYDINAGKDITEQAHPFEARMAKWSSLGSQVFDGSRNQISDEFESSKFIPDSVPTPAVHAINYGDSRPAVQSVNCGNDDVNWKRFGNLSSSSGGSNFFNKKTNNNIITKTTDSTESLIFPSSLSDNQKQLITLHLTRLPSSLPAPPPPWGNWQQLLLDELGGRINVGNENKCPQVWNPVSLLSTYCKRLTENGYGLKVDGQFQLEFAQDIFDARTETATTERVREIAETNQRKTLLKRLKITRERTKAQANQ